MNRTNFALLTTIILAIFLLAVTYFTKGLWDNVASVTVITTEHLAIALVIIIKSCLVSGIIISLTAYKKKGFHNLKGVFERGLIGGLIYGLIYGLICGLLGGLLYGMGLVLVYGLVGMLTDGLVNGLIYGLTAGLILGLIIGFILGLTHGLLNEYRRELA